MESEKNTRLIALVALVAGVGALSVGFSAYTRNLVISPSAEVTLDNDVFKVVFSKQSDSVDDSEITANVNDDGSSGESAKIDNSGVRPKISNLKAKFTKPGQKVTYEFYAVNSGELDAYLRNITFKNTVSNLSTKECKPTEEGNPATEDLTSICDSITLTVTVANDITTTETKTIEEEKKIDKHSTTYSSHPIKIEIEYPKEAEVPDGDFTVEFGDIELKYTQTSPLSD